MGLEDRKSKLVLKIRNLKEFIALKPRGHLSPAAYFCPLLLQQPVVQTASVEGNCPNGLSEEGTSEAGRASLASKPKYVRRSPAGTVSAHPGWSVGQCPGCLLVEQSGSSSPERARESHSPAPKLVLRCSRSPDPGLLQGLVACDLPGTASPHQSFLFHPDGFSGFLVCSEFHILLQ